MVETVDSASKAETCTFQKDQDEPLGGGLCQLRCDQVLSADRYLLLNICNGFIRGCKENGLAGDA